MRRKNGVTGHHAVSPVTWESKEDSFMWLRLHCHRITDMWFRSVVPVRLSVLSLILRPMQPPHCNSLLTIDLDLNSIRLLIMLILMENFSNASHSSLSGMQKSNKHQGHQTRVIKGAVWPSVCVLYTLWNRSLRAAGVYLASVWQLNEGFQYKSPWYRAVRNLHPQTGKTHKISSLTNSIHYERLYSAKST